MAERAVDGGWGPRPSRYVWSVWVTPPALVEVVLLNGLHVKWTHLYEDGLGLIDMNRGSLKQHVSIDETLYGLVGQMAALVENRL